MPDIHFLNFLDVHLAELHSCTVLNLIDCPVDIQFYVRFINTNRVIRENNTKAFCVMPKSIETMLTFSLVQHYNKYSFKQFAATNLCFVQHYITVFYSVVKNSIKSELGCMYSIVTSFIAILNALNSNNFTDMSA